VACCRRLKNSLDWLRSSLSEIFAEAGELLAQPLFEQVGFVRLQDAWNDSVSSCAHNRVSSVHDMAAAANLRDAAAVSGSSGS
jgi:hypothetical protein